MYNYKQGEGVDYPLFLFTSKFGHVFNVSFQEFPYDFIEIETIRSISVGCEDNSKPPLDPEVGETVCCIIEEYLSHNNEELLSYVCDNLDQKGSARQRKFNSWHIAHGNGKFVAAPHTIISKDDTEIYTCLIFDPLKHDEQTILESYEKEILTLESHKS